MLPPYNLRSKFGRRTVLWSLGDALFLKMIIDLRMGRLLLDQARGLAPSRCLPIVFAFFLRDPRRQRLIQIGGQRVNVWLVHAPQLGEAAIGFLAVAELQSVLRQNVADVAQLFGPETVVGHGSWRRTEDLRKIGDRVA